MNLLKHKYPQNIWAGEIVRLLKSSAIHCDPNALCYDAPCGNGIIGSLVSKQFPERKFLLLDNDERLLQSPYLAHASQKLQYTIGDIFSFKPQGENNIWLLINSLYCLPDAEELIQFHKNCFQYIIAVFPDIESSNFRYFSQKNPDFENPSKMNLKQTEELFLKHGYKAIFQKRICKIPFHKWNWLFDKLRLPLVLKNTVLTVFDKILFFLPGHYTIIAFIRYE